MRPNFFLAIVNLAQAAQTNRRSIGKIDPETMITDSSESTARDHPPDPAACRSAWRRCRGRRLPVTTRASSGLRPTSGRGIPCHVDEGQGFFDGELDAYICACQVPSRSATVTAT
jgi:hypothetical protein